MKNLRKKIYDVVEPNHLTKWSKVYDGFMLIIIVLSILPLTFRNDIPYFNIIDKITVSIFILDYLLRWITADFSKPNKPKWKAIFFYPFTLAAIIDMLSILPSVSACSKVFKLFRITRLLKVLRVLRFVRYSKSIQILIRVLKKEKSILLVVFYIALGYILLTALIMFNIEESSMFTNFFDAIYWATTTLTTVGYGDIYPLTGVGKIISMFSSLLGVAVIALPSGVITASYLEELREQKK